MLYKILGPGLYCARASSDVHEKLCCAMVRDDIVYAEKEMAERLAVKFGSKNILTTLKLTGICHL